MAFKVSPHDIQIDPSLGVIDQGTIDMKAPADFSETGDVSMPAAIGMNTPPPKKRNFFVRKAGATLAEQLGTPEVVETEPVGHMPTMPINVPERVLAPRSKNLSADAMASMLTPKFKPPVDKATEPESIVESVMEPPFTGVAAKTVVQETQTASGLPIPAKADLKDLILRYIQKAGPEASAKFFKKPIMHVHNWVNGKQEPPLSAAQVILDHSPKAREQYLKVVERVSIDFETGEGSFARDHTKEELPVDLCLAVKGDIPSYVHWVFVTAAAQYGVGQKMFTDTIIIRSRNMLADLFLKGKAEWAIWLDADVLPTIGSAPWWRAIVRDPSVSEKTCSYDFIKRLLSHQQPFVGGVYATRRRDGPLVTQPDLHPRGQADRIASDAIRKNKATGLMEVDWLSIGFCIVHRTVFETVRKNNPHLVPKLAGEPFPFFTPTGNAGEDVAFSLLARGAGFKLYLDTELFAAHIGRWAYVPSQSQFNGVLDFSNA